MWNCFEFISPLYKFSTLWRVSICMKQCTGKYRTNIMYIPQYINYHEGWESTLLTAFVISRGLSIFFSYKGNDSKNQLHGLLFRRNFTVWWLANNNWMVNSLNGGTYYSCLETLSALDRVIFCIWGFTALCHTFNNLISNNVQEEICRFV